MAQGLITESYLSDIASAIRSKNGQSISYTPSQMASAIQSIVSAGELTIISKTINENGVYTPSSDNADAFSGVVVNVPNTYNISDEGKVVASGSLSTQGSLSVYSNSIYDTTLFSQVNVDVSQPILVSKTITENGTYDPADDNADAYSEVVVNVSSGGGGGNYDNFLIAVGDKSGVVDDSSASIFGEYAFAYNKKITGIIGRSVTSISNNAFTNCVEMSFASFPLCTYIKNNAFDFCSKLETLSFPNCSYISAMAFSYCKKISEVNFPLCESIGRYAFYSCAELSNLSFPMCKSLGENAFYSCPKIQSIDFPECLYIGSYAFYSCGSISNVNLQKCISIMASAFYSASKLIDISMPKCEHIGSCAFSGCYRLESVNLPECKIIHYGCFNRCSALSDVNLPKLETISTSAFASCSKIETLSFPYCKSIDMYAFNGCVSLFSLYLTGSSVVSLRSSAIFSSTPMVNSSYYGEYGSIFVPASLVDAYKSAQYWSYYSDRITAYVE